MDKILNPKTGRYVQKDGKIGQQIILQEKMKRKTKIDVCLKIRIL